MGASWQAFYAHLCAASIIRAMPETEIPPAMRGGSLFAILLFSIFPDPSCPAKLAGDIAQLSASATIKRSNSVSGSYLSSNFIT